MDSGSVSKGARSTEQKWKSANNVLVRNGSPQKSTAEITKNVPFAPKNSSKTLKALTAEKAKHMLESLILLP